MGEVTILCPKCRMVNIPVDGRLACHGCTRGLAMLVAGEKEVGYQRWCDECGAYWPFTNEYFGVKRYERGEPTGSYVRETSGATYYCLADQRERNRLNYERKLGGLQTADDGASLP